MKLEIQLIVLSMAVLFACCGEKQGESGQRDSRIQNSQPNVDPPRIMKSAGNEQKKIVESEQVTELTDFAKVLELRIIMAHRVKNITKLKEELQTEKGKYIDCFQNHFRDGNSKDVSFRCDFDNRKDGTVSVTHCDSKPWSEKGYDQCNMAVTGSFRFPSDFVDRIGKVAFAMDIVKNEKTQNKRLDQR